MAASDEGAALRQLPGFAADGKTGPSTGRPRAGASCSKKDDRSKGVVGFNENAGFPRCRGCNCHYFAFGPSGVVGFNSAGFPL